MKETILNAIQSVKSDSLKGVELGLIDGIIKDEKKASAQIGYVNKDKQDVKQAINLIGMVKADFKSNRKLANDLFKAVKDFESRADQLGLDVPSEIRQAQATANKLLTEIDDLERLVNNI